MRCSQLFLEGLLAEDRNSDEGLQWRQRGHIVCQKNNRKFIDGVQTLLDEENIQHAA